DRSRHDQARWHGKGWHSCRTGAEIFCPSTLYRCRRRRGRPATLQRGQFCQGADGVEMNSQLRRLALDLGPLIVFFATFQFFGIFAATGAFMVVVLAALATGYALDHKLSPVALFTAAIVLVFGGLTLY